MALTSLKIPLTLSPLSIFYSLIWQTHYNKDETAALAVFDDDLDEEDLEDTSTDDETEDEDIQG